MIEEVNESSTDVSSSVPIYRYIYRCILTESVQKDLIKHWREREICLESQHSINKQQHIFCDKYHPQVIRWINSHTSMLYTPTHVMSAFAYACTTSEIALFHNRSLLSLFFSFFYIILLQ